MRKIKMELKENYNFENEFKNATGLEFNQYYKKFYKKLTYYISRFGINEIDAQGLANDAFIRAFEKIHMYNKQYEFSTWLYKIAQNLTLIHIKKNKNTILVDFNEEQDSEFESNTNALKFHIAKKQEQSQEISTDHITNFKYNEALKEIGKLSPKYKQIFLLRVIDEKSYADIADMLGIPLQTVKNRLHHGKIKLEKTLKHKFETIYEKEL